MTLSAPHCSNHRSKKSSPNTYTTVSILYPEPRQPYEPIVITAYTESYWLLVCICDEDRIGVIRRQVL